MMLDDALTKFKVFCGLKLKRKIAVMSYIEVQCGMENM
jgi:hypothetical protein